HPRSRDALAGSGSWCRRTFRRTPTGTRDRSGARACVDATPAVLTVDLPYLTADLTGIAGVLRSTDDDFVVDEEPAYAPSGTGDHVFVRIEKRGMTTPVAVDKLARALGVKARDIGVAGMKDRHAVTRQWLSLPPPVAPESVQALVLEDLTILEVVRHP